MTPTSKKKEKAAKEREAKALEIKQAEPKKPEVERQRSYVRLTIDAEGNLVSISESRLVSKLT